DRDRRQAGKGASTPAQTAFAILSLLATHTHGEVRQDAALKRGVDFLLASQKEGTWTNGRPIYTNAPGFDYYDAPYMTHSICTTALLAYRRACREGAEAAILSFFQGVPRANPQP
ncbi:MAG: hypothetical protein AB1758_09275, partial [Candidatus Eremiobacterota bacterium]